MGLSQGLVEGVINPLIATIYREDKTHKLNVLHAWWPGGLVIGGLLAYTLTPVRRPWQVKLSCILVPAIVYLVMVLGCVTRSTERVASNISGGRHVAEAGKPLFLLLFVCMWMTAATELGPDQWFPSVMRSLTGWQAEGVLFLVYTAGLMFVLRFFVGGAGPPHSRRRHAHRMLLDPVRDRPVLARQPAARRDALSSRSRPPPSSASARPTSGPRCWASPRSSSPAAARCSST